MGRLALSLRYLSCVIYRSVCLLLLLLLLLLFLCVYFFLSCCVYFYFSYFFLLFSPSLLILFLPSSTFSFFVFFSLSFYPLLTFVFLLSPSILHFYSSILRGILFSSFLCITLFPSVFYLSSCTLECKHVHRDVWYQFHEIKYIKFLPLKISNFISHKIHAAKKRGTRRYSVCMFHFRNCFIFDKFGI
jgi:hypothetical protein